MMWNWDFLRNRKITLPRRAPRPADDDRKLITVNGHEHEIDGALLSDMEVAGRIRMLMRGQLDHEAVCTTARDRIVYLADQLALRNAGAPPPAPAGQETILHGFVIVRDPGCAPEGKGPFPHGHVSTFVRELIACRPAGTEITVALLTWNHELWVDDGREMITIEDALAEPGVDEAIAAELGAEEDE